MKNILVFVLDCARSEKTILDFPGNSKWTKRSGQFPFLENLRSKGTTWTHYHSVSSHTPPNFASMFTGLLPSQHGILGHSWHIRHSLRKNIPTLSQVLTDNGYNTYAEFTGPLTPESGINRGLKHFRWRGRADYLHKGCNDYLADFFPKLKPPWFLCLHFWEAHYPYQDPKPFNRKS
ncbi:MAG: sulfatase-like hydrolase/transferase, partial [Nitrospinae bacterium]|nr:sulfatase-like hydrolase/transferase [Nitrospinota bacterium]